MYDKNIDDYRPNRSAPSARYAVLTLSSVPVAAPEKKYKDTGTDDGSKSLSGITSTLFTENNANTEISAALNVADSNGLGAHSAQRSLRFYIRRQNALLAMLAEGKDPMLEQARQISLGADYSGNHVTAARTNDGRHAFFNASAASVHDVVSRVSQNSARQAFIQTIRGNKGYERRVFIPVDQLKKDIAGQLSASKKTGRMTFTNDTTNGTKAGAKNHWQYVTSEDGSQADPTLVKGATRYASAAKILNKNDAQITPQPLRTPPTYVEQKPINGITSIRGVSSTNTQAISSSSLSLHQSMPAHTNGTIKAPSASHAPATAVVQPVQKTVSDVKSQQSALVPPVDKREVMARIGFGSRQPASGSPINERTGVSSASQTASAAKPSVSSVPVSKSNPQTLTAPSAPGAVSKVTSVPPAAKGPTHNPSVPSSTNNGKQSSPTLPPTGIIPPTRNGKTAAPPATANGKAQATPPSSNGSSRTIPSPPPTAGSNKAPQVPPATANGNPPPKAAEKAPYKPYAPPSASEPATPKEPPPVAAKPKALPRVAGIDPSKLRPPSTGHVLLGDAHTSPLDSKDSKKPALPNDKSASTFTPMKAGNMDHTFRADRNILGSITSSTITSPETPSAVIIPIKPAESAAKSIETAKPALDASIPATHEALPARKRVATADIPGLNGPTIG